MAAKLAALYYPHMGIENEPFLKNALLLWDNVDLICPRRHLPDRLEDPEQAAAFEYLARPLQPTDEDKEAVHEAIVELATSDLPDWFTLKSLGPLRRSQQYYYLDPRKFFHKTWEELRRVNVAKLTVIDNDPPWPGGKVPLTKRRSRDAYQTTEAFGHLMMSMIAEVCAGSTRQLVTDEIESYAGLDRYFKLIGGAKALKDKRKDFDRLATLSLTALNLSRVTMRSLVAIRAKEESNPRFRAMRHAYVNKLDSYIQRLATEAKNKHDVAEIERLFQQEITDDVGLLKEELKDEAKNVFMSKELCTAVVAAAGAFLTPPNPLSPASALVSAAALGQARVKYKAARNKTLAAHSMSWLYESKHRRFKLF